MLLVLCVVTVAIAPVVPLPFRVICDDGCGVFVFYCVCVMRVALYCVCVMLLNCVVDVFDAFALFD